MPYVYAGQYGPEALLDAAGNALDGSSAARTAAVTVTGGTLYTDRGKTSTTTTVAVDSRGNLSFFAEPGAYTVAVTVNGSTSSYGVSVPVDPLEPALLVAQALDAAYTAAGDLAVAGADGTPQRLGPPGDGQYLTKVGSTVGWAIPPATQVTTGGGGTPTYAFDARNYGTLDATGATNAAPVIQAALNAAGAAYDNDGRPRVVYLPAGTYRLDTPLNPPHGGGLVGESMRSTVLLPFGDTSGFEGNDSLAAPMTDCTFANFTIDGINQSNVSNPGVYKIAIKGFNVGYSNRCRWLNVQVRDIYATGFGVDDAQNAIMHGCIALRAGRAYPRGSTSESGGSGYGIGVGAYAVENQIINQCVAIDCGNNGMFFELLGGGTGPTPNPVESIATMITNCHVERCGKGIRDAGLLRFMVANCNLINNDMYGFMVDETGLAPSGGDQGLLIGNIISSNGIDGVLIGRTDKTNGYRIVDNTIVSNVGHGVHLLRRQGDVVGPNHEIARNRCDNNGLSGICLDGQDPTTLTNIHVRDNICRNNGTATAGDRNGITVTCSTVGVRIERNDCYDSGTTKTQQYGIRFTRAASTHTDALVRDNVVRGNLTGGMQLLPTTFTNPWVEGNVGFNPQGPVAVTATASPMTVTAGQTPEMVYVSGGTVSSITKGGLPLGTSGGFDLAPGESVIITYTAAPTITRDRR